jgi:hypothetical protein
VSPDRFRSFAGARLEPVRVLLERALDVVDVRPDSRRGSVEELFDLDDEVALFIRLFVGDSERLGVGIEGEDVGGRLHAQVSDRRCTQRGGGGGSALVMVAN